MLSLNTIVCLTNDLHMCQAGVRWCKCCECKAHSRTLPLALWRFTASHQSQLVTVKLQHPKRVFFFFHNISIEQLYSGSICTYCLVASFVFFCLFRSDIASCTTTVTTEPWNDSKILFLISFQLILVFLCQLTSTKRLTEVVYATHMPTVSPKVPPFSMTKLIFIQVFSK